MTSFVLQKPVTLLRSSTEWPQRSGDACCGTIRSHGTRRDGGRERKKERKKLNKERLSKGTRGKKERK